MFVNYINKVKQKVAPYLENLKQRLSYLMTNYSSLEILKAGIGKLPINKTMRNMLISVVILFGIIFG